MMKLHRIEGAIFEEADENLPDEPNRKMVSKFKELFGTTRNLRKF